jgi:VanZ family protein
MGLVVWLSHQSQPPLPEALLRVSDKLLHMAEYAPMGFLWTRILGGRLRRRALLAVALSALFGLTDEIHQFFVPGREASVLDLLADVGGSALGALLALAPRALRRDEKRGDAS